MMGPWGMYGWGDGFSFLPSIFFWIIFIFGLVLLVRGLSGDHHHYRRRDDESGGNEDSALGIVRERYAKGEIDKKEFEQKKKELNG